MFILGGCSFYVRVLMDGSGAWRGKVPVSSVVCIGPLSLAGTIGRFHLAAQRPGRRAEERRAVAGSLIPGGGA